MQVDRFWVIAETYPVWIRVVGLEGTGFKEMKLFVFGVTGI